MSKAPVEQLTFETALGELESIVRDLERGDTALEDSITAYERGIALKNHCENTIFLHSDVIARLVRAIHSYR